MKEDLKVAVSADVFKQNQLLFAQKYATLKNDFDWSKKETEILKSLIESATNLEPSEKSMLIKNVNLFFKTIQTQLNFSQQIYSDFNNFSKKKLAKQIKNLDSQNLFDENQIEDLIDENPDFVNKLVQEQICGKASCQMQNAAQDILEKCEGIKRLQGQVRELLEMIKDISLIVSAQGDQIDSIGICVFEAKDYMQSAKTNLIKAKTHHEAVGCVGLLANGLYSGYCDLRFGVRRSSNLWINWLILFNFYLEK